MNDLQRYMEEEYSMRLYDTIDRLIGICRYKEKKVEGEGVLYLKDLLKKNIIQQDLYDRLEEAVLNPDKDYEIKIT